MPSIDLSSRAGCEAAWARYGSIIAIARAVGRSRHFVRDRFIRHGATYDASSNPTKGRGRQEQEVQHDAETVTEEDRVEAREDEELSARETKEAIAEEHRRLDAERQTRLLRQLMRRAALEQSILEAVKEANPPQPPLVIPEFPPCAATGSPEIMVAQFSDLHVGKFTSSYNSEEFLARFQAHIHTIGRLADIQRNSCPVDELVMALTGDETDGEAIYPGHAWGVDQGALNQVFQGLLPAFEAAVGYLLREKGFKRIRFVAVPGNHGRVSREADPSTNWDMNFYKALQWGMRDWHQVEFELPTQADGFYVLTKIGGWGFLLTHGDGIKMHLSLPWYGIHRAAAEYSESIPGWQYWLLGHFHRACHVEWQGKEIFIGGSYSTDDLWALKLLKQRTRAPRQWAFFVHERHGITARYPIDVTRRMPLKEAA